MAERSGRASADARMTAEREERKFLLAPEHAAGFVEAVSGQLSPHRHTGKGANRLPLARHHATTVYFDTPSGDLYRAAVGGERHEKLRAREYYDLHPELTELATDPGQLVRYDSTLWLELKLREGTHTEKRRIGIPKGEVARYFETGQVSPEMLAIQRAAHREEAEAVLQELDAFRAQYAEPLAAIALVNYRRQAWQDATASLRVTLDRELCVFTPPDNLWTRRRALVRERLGTPLSRLTQLVVEVKARGDVPEWLEKALAEAQARGSTFSKFRYAYEAVRPPDA